MKPTITLTTVALILLAASTAAAQGRTCQYDLECGVGQACNDDGQCVARGGAGSPSTARSAEEACGDDRRCRLDRLKRKNEARRHADLIDEERYVQRMLDEREKKRLEDHPREAAPWSAALRVSRLGPLGLHGGFTIVGRLQPAFEFTWAPDLTLWAPTTAESNGVNGKLAGFFARAGIAYFLLDDWFSPYLSGGFQIGNGRFEDWNAPWDGFGGFGRRIQARFHAAEVGGGFDMQFKFGLNTRLGLVYRPLVYNQARIGPGQYDPVLRQGLADWYRRGASVDVVWLLGWAF